MISNLLPDDIKNLILSLWDEKYPDKEMDKMLPPRFVRDAVLAEIGVLAPRGDAQQELARDWCRRQVDIQTRAMQINSQLNEKEPLTQEMAMLGELPRWAVEPWAVSLLFDWSEELENAVVEAEKYLEGSLR